MAIPTRGDFHNLFARAFTACEEAAAGGARAFEIELQCKELSGEEWERRLGLIRLAKARLYAAQKELEGARSKLKNAWDKDVPFPNPT